MTKLTTKNMNVESEHRVSNSRPINHQIQQVANKSIAEAQLVDRA